MKQKWLKIMAVILTMTMSLGIIQAHASEQTTSDWQNHWAASQIQEAMGKDWILTTDQFRPNDDVTRAEFIKIINRAFGFSVKTSGEPFTDVNSSHWWYDEVRIAIKAGYITTTQSTFRPTDSITREEAATIIARIKKIEDANHDKIKAYSDYSEVASWAINGVEGVIENGYMGQGITAFRPKDNITRAEAVVTISRVSIPSGIETSFRGAVITADNKLEIASHMSYSNSMPAELTSITVTLTPSSNGSNISVEQMVSVDSLIKKITIPLEQLQVNQEYNVMVAINETQEQLWMGDTKTSSYQSGKNKITVTNKNKVLTIKREQVTENTGKVSAVSIHGEDLGIDTNYLSATSLLLFKDAVQTNEIALVSKNNVKKLSNANKGIDVSKLADGTYQIAVKDTNGTIHNLVSSQEKDTQYKATTVRRSNKLKEVAVDATKGKYPTLTVTTKAANSTNVADVLLDPGHGGDYNPGVADSGACSSVAGIACEHTEMLNLMKMVRQGLENHGLKVALTREINYAGGKLPLYGENSRTDKVYNSGAKVTIASHYNSAGSSHRGAFAMHAMQDTNELANKIITNLSNIAKQPKDLNQHTACDVTKKTGDGTSYGYDNVAPTSDCYYMIREYGGNITKGKNKDANGNFYRDNYLTPEPVLVEYFNGASSTDANNFKNNKAKYADSVVKAIVEYFGITYKKTLLSESLELYELDTYNYEAIDNLK